MRSIYLLFALLGCSGRATSTSPTAPIAAKPSPVLAPSTTTPCFDGPPLVATTMHKDLEKFTMSLYTGDDTPAPQGTYGSCGVERNVVRDAEGKVVAELGCGVRILQRGILDDLGLQLGARGQDVLDRKPKPFFPLTCTANGPDQVRCSFGRGPDSDTDDSWYVVAGTLDERALDDGVLTGDAAIAYFAPRELVEIDVSVWCH